MDDTISRGAALNALEKVAELFPWKVPGNRDSYDRYNEAWNDSIGRAEIEIEKLPSAQQWIPTSKKLPEKENTRVITQTNAGSVIIDCVYGGTDVYGHHVWRDGKGGLYWDDEIVAWMPIVIPEPWKGE